MTYRQSDPSVVLGDGRADHTPLLVSDDGAGMGKGWAGWLNEHSTHAEGKNVPNKSVSRTLL